MTSATTTTNTKKTSQYTPSNKMKRTISPTTSLHPKMKHTTDPMKKYTAHAIAFAGHSAIPGADAGDRAPEHLSSPPFSADSQKAT